LAVTVGSRGSVESRSSGGRTGRTPGTDVVDDGLDDGVMESLSTPGIGELEPEDERGLDGEVVRDIVQDKTEGNALEEGEKPKDGPVRQPLYVILSSGGLDGAVGEVGRKSPTDEVGDGKGEGVDEDHGEEDCAGDEDTVRLRNLSLLLELDEDRVPAELFVKLSDVLSKGLMRLLNRWVSSDLLGDVLSGLLRRAGSALGSALSVGKTRVELGLGISRGGGVLDGRHFWS